MDIRYNHLLVSTFYLSDSHDFSPIILISRGLPETYSFLWKSNGKTPGEPKYPDVCQKHTLFYGNQMARPGRTQKQILSRIEMKRKLLPGIFIDFSPPGVLPWHNLQMKKYYRQTPGYY